MQIYSVNAEKFILLNLGIRNGSHVLEIRVKFTNEKVIQFNSVQFNSKEPELDIH